MGIFQGGEPTLSGGAFVPPEMRREYKPPVLSHREINFLEQFTLNQARSGSPSGAVCVEEAVAALERLDWYYEKRKNQAADKEKEQQDAAKMSRYYEAQKKEQSDEHQDEETS